MSNNSASANTTTNNANATNTGATNNTTNSNVVTSQSTASSSGSAPSSGVVGVQQSGNYASASLYVGDLAPDVTEALLFEIFNAVGPVASVRVCRDAATRRSLGYAYVNFHRVDDAERALDTMNFKNIRNRPCRIMWSHRDPALRKSGLGNIFVNRLAKSIDNKQLYDTFSMFGNILSCKVAMNSKRESLGYGFVHYETEESAQNAIARVDGKVIAGEKVSVSTFKSKKERGVNKNKFTNVFCKNLPPESTKESVEELFKKYGTITSSVVQVDREQKNRAFSFINFETSEQAQAAVDGLNNQELDGRKLYVSRAQKREEREKELRDRFEQLKQERAKKYAGVNLYVKNLADDMDDKKLTEEFSKFGTITNAAIMIDQSTKKSRGFGFVCFSTPEEATKAVTEMNGRMIDGKPLYVALAQRKEARRAQLEAQYAARAKIGGPQQSYNPAAAMMNQYPGRGGYGGINPMMQAYNQQQMAALAAVSGRGGWNPNQPNPMMAAAAMGRMPGVNYQLLPVSARVGSGSGINPMLNPSQSSQQGRVPGPRNQNPNTRRGPNNPQNMNNMSGAVNPAGLNKPNQQQSSMQQQAVRYSDNVRNRSNQQIVGQNISNAGPNAEQVVMPAPNEPLTIKALAAAPEEIRKQMIGERLFPLIKLQEPLLAGKITGMLLEMDNGELIHLLESQAALNEKIQEALQVLHAHPQEVQQAPQQETEA